MKHRLSVGTGSSGSKTYQRSLNGWGSEDFEGTAGVPDLQLAEVMKVASYLYFARPDFWIYGSHWMRYWKDRKKPVGEENLGLQPKDSPSEPVVSERQRHCVFAC